MSDIKQRSCGVDWSDVLNCTGFAGGAPRGRVPSVAGLRLTSAKRYEHSVFRVCVRDHRREFRVVTLSSGGNRY